MTTQPKYVFFDFDGTLVDSLDILVSHYNQLAPRFNCIPVEASNREELRKTAPTQILKQHNIKHWKIPFLAYFMRKSMKEGLKDVAVFEGIPELLENLIQAGYLLGVLTSNSSKNARMVLQKNGLEHQFKLILSSGRLLGKTSAMKKILKSLDISPQEIVYIGDETRDITFCQKLGIPVIAVTYGFAHEELLTQKKPNFLAHSPSEIFDLISGQ